ncbi:hypothetical protein [uncultured Croceitalea sp.]|uniref:hypothetical protein n=1 Tax=uncultured Croceitalea sp. TaxID=1798908 RepID=UPI00374E662F
MSSKTKALLCGVATIFGTFTLLLFTTITRDILFRGLSLCSSSGLELLFGSLMMFTSAVTAGFITSLIVIRKSYLPHILISLAVVAKMSVMANCSFLTGSFLFESGINASLVLGLWLGNYSALKFPITPVS